MSHSYIWRLTAALILAASLFQTGSSIAIAQEGGEAVLLAPNLDDFPRVSAYLFVNREDGSFVSGLQAADVMAVEDGNPYPLTELQEQNVGTQFSIVVNPGRGLVLRDAAGVSRFDVLAQALLDWGKAQKQSDGREIGLQVFGQPGTSGLSGNGAWMNDLQAYLESYQNSARSSAPALEALSTGLDMVAQSTTEAVTGRGVLFITPMIDGNLEFGVQSLAGRARQENTHISVWLVTSSDALNSPEVAQLQELTRLTGGRFFAYTGTEAIPSLDEYIEPLGKIYTLSYESQNPSSGPRQLKVEVHAGDKTIVTPEHTYMVSVQPPTPVLVSLPTKIHRAALVSEDGESYRLSPQTQSLDVAIKFPDGYERSILTSTLTVDGSVVATNSQAPFDHFNWDLAAYQDDGEHTIQVDVVDALGLSGSTGEQSIKVTVDHPKKTVVSTVSKHPLAFFGLFALFGGAVFVLLMILGGWIHPRTFGKAPAVSFAARLRRARLGEESGMEKDSAKNDVARPRFPQWMSRLQRSRWRSSSTAIAYLSRISEPDQPAEAPIPLTMKEIYFGSQPDKVQLVLEDPSIEIVHTRLYQVKGVFWVADEGTVAGTWINYVPVSKQGSPLEHGDLLHVGKVGFRYLMKNPKQVYRPIVVKEEPGDRNG